MKLKQMVHDQQEAEKKRIGSQELQIILAVCINQNFNEQFFFLFSIRNNKNKLLKNVKQLCKI